MKMLVIDLNFNRRLECHICNSPTSGKFGVPMYEDMVLPNNWLGEWFGQTVCEVCFLAQNKLQKPINQNKFAMLLVRKRGDKNDYCQNR